MRIKKLLSVLVIVLTLGVSFNGFLSCIKVEPDNPGTSGGNSGGGNSGGNSCPSGWCTGQPGGVFGNLCCPSDHPNFANGNCYSSPQSAASVGVSMTYQCTRYF